MIRNLIFHNVYSDLKPILPEESGGCDDFLQTPVAVDWAVGASAPKWGLEFRRNSTTDIQQQKAAARSEAEVLFMRKLISKSIHVYDNFDNKIDIGWRKSDENSR